MNFMDRIRNNKLALVVIVLAVVFLAAQYGTGTNTSVEEGNTDSIVKQEEDLAARQAELDRKEKELDELAKELESPDTEVEITTEDTVEEDALTPEDRLYVDRMLGTNIEIVTQFSAIRELFSQFDSMDYDEFALQANEVLNKLQGYLDEAKAIQPTDRFAEVDEVYNYALDEYEEFVRLALSGIENIDNDMIDAAADHLIVGNAFVDEATMLLEDKLPELEN